MNQTDFQKVTDFASLYRAYKKSLRGQGHKKSKLKFKQAAVDGIYQIKQSLENHTYKITPYTKFKVYEPKERIIEAGSFKDKIVQHSLCDNILLPMLTKEFIPTNVAGQIGKGTLCGQNYLKNHMLAAHNKYGDDCWIVKGDIEKYFYTINHQLMKDVISYFVQDKDILWLCNKFIDSTDGDGLPLGNQVTQVFALLFLSGLDQFVTEEIGVEFYGRYMDDFYLIVKDRSYAKQCLSSIELFISSLNLKLNKKTQIIPFKNGIKYCGFHTYVTKNGKCIRKLLNEKKRKAKKKYCKLAKLARDGKIPIDKFEDSYEAWKNHISYGNCIKFGYSMDERVKAILKES